MRKYFGVAMLSGMMLLGSFSNVMAAQPTESPKSVVSEAGIMPRAVTLNYGNEVIPYDVSGTFYVENWSAGSIPINNIFVKY